jgi:predicted PurR-regulated permease PerM
VGPLIGTIPCLFLALLSGFGEVVALLVIVLVSQQIDNIFISPKILGSTVGMNPFWIVFSVVVGGILFGAIGMVLFVPLTSVILKLANERIDHYRNQKAL